MKQVSKIKNHSLARFATAVAGGVFITLLSTSCSTTNYAPAGDFSLSYRGDGRNLSRMPSNISPGQLQAQLNQNPTRRNDGLVVVTKSPNGWLVTDAERGSRSMLKLTQSNAGLMRVVRAQKGGSSHVDIQRIEFVRNDPPEPGFFGRRRPGNDRPDDGKPEKPPGDGGKPDDGGKKPDDPSKGKYPPGSGHVNDDGQWIPNPKYTPPSAEKAGPSLPGGFIRQPASSSSRGAGASSAPKMRMPSVPKLRIPSTSRSSKR